MATVAHPRRQPAILELSPNDVSMWTWLTTVDHKRIGILYLVTGGVFFALAGLEAVLMRTQLVHARNDFLQPDFYNAMFTVHGTTMMFLAVIPILFGFANYFLPLQIGARDMAFPRLNALSFWLVPIGGLILYYSFLAGAPPDVGWFADAPLTEHPFSLQSGLGVDCWNLGVGLSSVGTILASLNLMVTAIKLRAPGMTAGRMPVFVWMMLATSSLVILSFPALTAGQIMLLFDRRLGTQFFVTAAGGDVLLWQHLFWFFGHPEVYILILPAFGIISEAIPVFSRKPIFGYKFVVASGFLIAFYAYCVWGHHMFATGLGLVPEAFFSANSLLIAIPTGVKVLSWLATMWGGRLRFTTAMLFAMGLLVVFTMGGITGVQFALAPIDWQATESYYVVAHFHYTLVGGSLIGIFVGAYYWLPKITGRLFNETLGKWHFWLTLIGINLTFFPQHVLGLLGMSRRVFT